MADKAWSDLPRVELAIEGSMSGELPVAKELRKNCLKRFQVGPLTPSK
jgi:hypothetical protein